MVINDNNNEKDIQDILELTAKDEKPNFLQVYLSLELRNADSAAKDKLLKIMEKKFNIPSIENKLEEYRSFFLLTSILQNN